MRNWIFTGLVYLMLLVGLIPAPASMRKLWFKRFIWVLQTWGEEGQPIGKFESEPYFMWKYRQY